MSWNYRVVRHTTPDGGEWYGVHEVYYTDSGKPRAYSIVPERLSWEREEEADTSDDAIASGKSMLAKMMLAFDKPVLCPKDFERVIDDR